MDSGTGGSAGSSGSGGDGVVLTSGTGGTVLQGAGGSVLTGAGGDATGSSGGATGSGGVPTGGGGASTAGTGGSTLPGTGGTAPAEPKVVTSAQGAFWKVGTLTEVTDRDRRRHRQRHAPSHQSWDGFGGAFNEVGWNVLSHAQRGRPRPRDEAAVRRDRRRALRVSDGSRSAPATTPSIATRSTRRANDYTMANFSIDRDRQKLIPYIQAALAIKPDLHLWASPWTPPTWMKDNDAMDGGNMKDDAQIAAGAALYLARFVEEYGKAGHQDRGDSPAERARLRDRTIRAVSGRRRCMTKFIGTYLGPTFAARSVTAQIYLGTMSNNDAGKDGTIVSTVTGDATAMSYVKGFGLQWNMLRSVSGLKSTQPAHRPDRAQMRQLSLEPGGLPRLQRRPRRRTTMPTPWRAGAYIRDWIKAGVTSYSAWNMVLDTVGQEHRLGARPGPRTRC